jgi:peptide/nickel transport system permease protein
MRASRPVAGFLARRLLVAAGLLLVVSALIFVATEVLPGDAAQVLLGQEAATERVDVVREQLDLDRPALQRYVDWISGAVTGDLGTSVVSRRQVTDIVAGRVENTLILAITTALVVYPMILLLGFVMGTREGRRVDTILSAGTMINYAIPTFVTAVVLSAVFGVWLEVLPPVSLVPLGGNALDRPSILVLPVVAMALPTIAWGARLTRAAVAEASRTPHVEAARLAGITESRVLWRHLLPTALPPIAQVFARLAAVLLASTVVVETVFNYPGLGLALVQATTSRDVALVQGIGLLLAAIEICAYVLADLVGVLAVPKLRTPR